MPERIMYMLVFALLPLVRAACPSFCSGHGRCTESGCACDRGFAGDDCSLRPQVRPSPRKGLPSIPPDQAPRPIRWCDSLISRLSDAPYWTGRRCNR